MQDQLNLAESLDEDERRKIARQVIEDYERDNDTRAEWMAIHADWIELYYQTDVPQSPAWEGSSTESLPLLTEAVNQFHSRAVKAMFPLGRNIIQARPVGVVDPESLARAERVSAHMNWQLLVQNAEYRSDKDALLMATGLHGSMFTKTYPTFNPYRPLIKNVRPHELVIPYGIGPRKLEEIERKTEIIYMTPEEGDRRAQEGFFVEAPREMAMTAKSDVDAAVDDAEGRQDTRGRHCMVLEQHCLINIGEEGTRPYIAWVDKGSGKLLRLTPRYKHDARGNIQPIEYYTQYDFLPNPNGTLGLGMGHLIANINIAVNKLLRMTIDAGELSTIGNQSGFINSSAAVPGEEIELQLGQFIKLDSPTGDIRQSIYQMSFPGPNQAITEAIIALMARSDRLSTVSEALTGQMDKVMQPTAVLALIDQGLQVFNTVIQRLIDSQQKELAKVFRLNFEYMDDQAYFAVLDGGIPQQGNIAKTDYRPDLQVIPIADPNAATEQQKLARAQALREFAYSSPLVQSSPMHLYSIERKYLETIGVQDVDRYLPMPQQQEPVRMDDPKVENSGALLVNPQIPPVHMDQNHLQHIKAHREFLMDEQYGPLVGPDGRQAMEEHIGQHLRWMYLATETDALEELEDGQDGPPAMAAE